MTVWPNGLKTIPRVTDEFGMRVNPVDGGYRLHAGIDLVGWANNKSPCDGQVVFAAYNGGAGNQITIRAANGDEFKIFHNARFLVSYGQWVREGQDVGVMGTTGQSTGVHCHFECHPGGGAAVNPRDYMARAVTAGTGATPINEKDEDMTYALINRVAGDQLPGVPKDAVFIGSGTDPLVWVSNYGPELINGVVVAEWDHTAIAARISQVGLRGSGADLNKVFKSMADARAGVNPVYTLGAGKVTLGDVTLPPIDNAPVVAGLAAVVKAVEANTAATNKLNPKD